MEEPEDELRRQAGLFARYLVGSELPEELEERFVRANRVLFGSPAPGPDSAMLSFVTRHPWTLSLLDGACGVLRPHGLLRRKILLMAAIAEASPHFPEAFLPRDTGRAKLMGNLLGLGFSAVARAVLGIVLFPIACRPRS